MSSEEDRLFCKIALHNKLVSAEQVKKVQALQRARYPDKSLRRLFLAKRYLSERQAQKIKRAVAKLSARVAIPSDDRSPSRLREAEEAHDVEEAEEVDEVEEVEDAEEDVDEVEEVEDEGGSFVPVVVVQPDSLLPCELPGREPELTELLRFARERGASDLHLSVGSRPFLRLHGQIVKLDRPVLTHELSEKLIFEILRPHDAERFRQKWDLDLCLELRDGRYRTNVLRQRRGTSSVFRVINETVPSLDELGLPEDVEKLTTFHQGLVLVTGPAGSGKSSTLASLIEVINQNRQDHIITLEDPIEYIFECKQCNVTQREIDKHTLSWGNALRAALREDPDVIMVGEMRDLDTISLAITAAETGHLVLGTLHTRDATRTVDRVLDAFPPKEQAQIRAMVSESLKGIVCQQLIPRKNGRGRVLALEILYWTPAVGNLIREGTTFKLFSIIQTNRRQGMRLMDDSLRDLVEQGEITREQARFHASNRKNFE